MRESCFLCFLTVVQRCIVFSLLTILLKLLYTVVQYSFEMTISLPNSWPKIFFLNICKKVLYSFHV